MTRMKLGEAVMRPFTRSSTYKALALCGAIGAAGLATLVGFGDKIFPPVELKRTNAPYASIRKDDWKFGGINMFYDLDGDGKPDEQLSLWNPDKSLYRRLMEYSDTEPTVIDLQKLDRASDVGRGYDHYVTDAVKPEQQRWITPRTNKNAGNFLSSVRKK